MHYEHIYMHVQDEIRPIIIKKKNDEANYLLRKNCCSQTGSGIERFVGRTIVGVDNHNLYKIEFF